MIADGFDSRTLACMQIALERVCRGRPGGDSPELRKLIAESIILCAKGGKTGLGQLADAGERSLARIRGEAKSA